MQRVSLACDHLLLKLVVVIRHCSWVAALVQSSVLERDG